MYRHRYFPHTDADVSAMLERIGVSSVDELFDDIPAVLRLNDGGYDLPGELSESEVREYFDALQARNKALVCFAGAGFYDHYSPAVVAALAQRSEFLTAYTPYQPEISQGTLQYIFEYQSMISMLTGLDVANASLYDGATATAEAMLMCVASARKRNKVLVSATVGPVVLEVLRTYARYKGVRLDVVPEKGGVTDRDAMFAMLGAGDVAGVIVASPNYYGVLENMDGWAERIHRDKALFVVNTHAVALGVLRTPAEWGADIAVGEAQSLGFPLNYGGPGLGYMCVTKALMRKMPGRIVGATTDVAGQRVFVLTLQAREQHIRRDKATSNICSNQGLMTLYAAIYMSLMGPEGLRQVNMRSHAAAQYALERIETVTRARRVFADKPFLNEFVIGNVKADQVLERAAAAGILAGVKLSADRLMIAFTEMRTQQQIDRLVELIKSTEDE